MKTVLFFLPFWLHIAVCMGHNLVAPRLRIPHMSMPKGRQDVPIASMQQMIDHFNSSNTGIFAMRYAYNDQFYVGGGPLFVFIGGEAFIEDQMSYIFVGGQVIDLANKVGAYLVLPEHRFYGESIPNDNLELSNLQYLTVQQVLADLAAFIKDRKKNIPGMQNSKVVVFGGSYPGSLAAWMRQYYPDVVHAAYSSSGIFKIKVDNYEFNEIVNNGISSYSGCSQTIYDGITTMESLLRTVSGVAQVKADFSFSTNYALDYVVGKQAFFNALMFIIDTNVQYNGQVSLYDIGTMCGNLTGGTGDAYTRFIDYIDGYGMDILNNNNTDLNLDRSWMYQICTELGMFVTTDSPNQPFNDTVPISYWNLACMITFGSTMTPLVTNAGVYQANSMYGEAKLNATKVVYLVGTIDPWSALGLQASYSVDSPLYVINGSSHCADLLPDYMVNSTALAKARKEASAKILSWL